MTNGMAAVNTLMYGLAMNDRLTKSDWIKHGLRTLAHQGANALKVGAMAATLDVSRGSFYWHFRDIAEFRAGLLQRWQEQTTDQVVKDLAEQAEPDRLRHLLRRAFADQRSLERAIRSWAAHDADVAAIVARVDSTRIAYIANLLAAAGVEHERAQHRAAFIYWAYLGQAIVMDPRHSSIAALAIDDISGLFESGPWAVERRKT